MDNKNDPKELFLSDIKRVGNRIDSLTNLDQGTAFFASRISIYGLSIVLDELKKWIGRLFNLAEKESKVDPERNQNMIYELRNSLMIEIERLPSERLSEGDRYDIRNAIKDSFKRKEFSSLLRQSDQRTLVRIISKLKSGERDDYFKFGGAFLKNKLRGYFFRLSSYLLLFYGTIFNGFAIRR